MRHLAGAWAGFFPGGGGMARVCVGGGGPDGNRQIKTKVSLFCFKYFEPGGGAGDS